MPTVNNSNVDVIYNSVTANAVTSLNSNMGNITGNVVTGTQPFITNLPNLVTVDTSEDFNVGRDLNVVENIIVQTGSITLLDPVNGNVFTNANIVASEQIYAGSNVVAQVYLVGQEALVHGNLTAGTIATDNFTYANGEPFGTVQNYGNANVAAFLPTYTGTLNGSSLTVTGTTTANGIVASGTVSGANFTTPGTISATGNIITSGYVFGNAALMTGLPSGANAIANAQIAAYLASGTDTSNIITTANISGSYVLGNGAFLTGVAASSNYGNSNVTTLLSTGITSNVITTGNVSGQYFIGNGALLTGIAPASSYGNANVAVYLPTDPTIISIQGNVANLQTKQTADEANIATLQTQVYGNANVAAYLPTNATIIALQNAQYGNSNVAAYLPTNPTITNLSNTVNQNSSDIANNASNISVLQNQVYGNANVATYLTTYSGNIGNITTNALIATAVKGGNITTSNDAITSSTGNITIDPFPVGAGGTVFVQGNLYVSGTTTTVDSNNVAINDLVFNVANNASISSLANGGGLGVGPANAEYATMLYSSTANTWNSNLTFNAPAFTGNASGLYGIVNNPVAGDIIITDSAGNAVDSGKYFADNATTNSNYWSSLQTANYVIQELLNVPSLPPVNLATTANVVTKSGNVTIDGVATVPGNYVLFKNQTNQDNGVWVTSAGAWVRQAYVGNAYANVSTQTTYSQLNINNGIINVLAGTANKNLQFQVTIVNPAATFGNSIVYVTATTKLPIAGTQNRFVDTNAGNDTTNNGSSAFPYATLTQALVGAQYPLVVTTSGSANDSSAVTWTNANNNTLVQSVAQATNSAISTLTGVQTFNANSTRIHFKNTVHSTGSAAPFHFNNNAAMRNYFQNITATTTAASWIEFDTSATNFITFDNITVTNLNSASLPAFTNPFTINVVNQESILSFSGTGAASTIINIINSDDGYVRVPGTYLGNITWTNAAFGGKIGSVNIPSGVITNQTTLTTVLNYTTDSNYDGYYLITGFTPTTFQSGAIIGKQTIGGVATQTWYARTAAYAPAILTRIDGSAYSVQTITTTGNISGSYVLGNGAFLTGIAASSNYGDSNVTSLLSTGITSNVITTANVSGQYFIGNGAYLTGVTGDYNNSSVANYLPTYSGNLNSLNSITVFGNSYYNSPMSLQNGAGISLAGGGNIVVGFSGSSTSIDALGITATGNITGNYFIGNGSQLTGVNTTSLVNGTSNVIVAPSGNINFNVAGANAGYISSTQVAFGILSGGNSAAANTVSIGYQAGGDGQGDDSVAVGFFAGNVSQGAYSVAVGSNAGANNQSSQAVAIGVGAGQNTQSSGAVAIGYNAGFTGQGLQSVAVGQGAGGNTAQGAYSVAVGFNAGYTAQGGHAVAIGYTAGQTTQGTNSVAIGYTAGQTTQGSSAVAVGFQAGFTGQGCQSTALGLGAGKTNQGTNSVAVGYNAGFIAQSPYSVAVGAGAAGASAQQTGAIAVGYQSAATNQGASAISIGYQAAQLNQGASAISIGGQAGNSTQGQQSVAIGYNAAPTNQGANAVAIGFQAGFGSQPVGAVAVGYNAGQSSTGTAPVAIGQSAGGSGQKSLAVAVGFGAGGTNQGNAAVALGAQSGAANAGLNSIAIGQFAGQSNIGNNSIIINATGSAINQATANTFTVAPVRNDTGNVSQVLYYNTTTKEVTYAAPSGNVLPALSNWSNWGAYPITAPSVSPSIPTNSTLTYSYRQLGPKQWEVWFQFSMAGSPTGYNIGSGDYLITLPNSLSFDTTQPGQTVFTTSAGWNTTQYGIPTGGTIILNSTTGSNNGINPFGPLVVPYTATQFRIFFYEYSYYTSFWGTSLSNPFAAGTFLNFKFEFTST